MIERIASSSVAKRLWPIYGSIAFFVVAIREGIDAEEKAVHLIPVLGPIVAGIGFGVIFLAVTCLSAFMCSPIPQRVIGIVLKLVPSRVQSNGYACSACLFITSMLAFAATIAVSLRYLKNPNGLEMVILVVATVGVTLLAGFVASIGLASFVTLSISSLFRMRPWDSYDKNECLMNVGYYPAFLVLSIIVNFTMITTILKDPINAQVYQWIGAALLFSPALLYWDKLQRTLGAAMGKSDSQKGP